MLLWEAADNNDRDNLVGMLRLPCPDCGQPIDQLGGLFCPSCTSTLDLLALVEGGRPMTTTRSRPTTLPSTTTRLRTERGNLYVTISTDDDGEPFEVFGTLGKAGSFEGGVTELACRLVSLHLRRGTPLEELIGQCQGIHEMQPWPNQLNDGTTVFVHGLGDAIAHVLKGFLKSEVVVEATEAKLAA